MGAGAGGAAADPERISQSDFQSFTDDGTYATWAYNGYTASDTHLYSFLLMDMDLMVLRYSNIQEQPKVI